MKKFPIVLFLGLFLVLPPIQSQAQRFIGAVVGGVNLAQVDGDKLGGFHRIGFNVGPKVAAVLSDRWQLSLELLYSQQGSSRSKDDDPSSPYDKIKLNFVEAPVMINFSDWKVQASAGFSYARLINYEVVDFSGADITDLEDYNPAVFYIIFGATYYPNEKWGINVRWSKALTDLRADENDNKLISRVIGIRGIYFF